MVSFSIILLFIGLTGIAAIVYRKIPVLLELSPQQVETKKENVKFFIKVKEKIKNNKIAKFFCKEILLQKILSKITVFLLKIENKTSNWLIKIRQNSQKSSKNESKFSKDFWGKISKK